MGLMAASPATAAPAKPKTASVSVLHAIPGLTVDLCAGGKVLIPGFTPGTLAGPLNLPAATYDLGLQAAVPGIAVGTACAGPFALSASGAVKAGRSYTVTANLDGFGKPALNLFANNQAAIATGKGGLTVRHIAAAPAVDVYLNGTVVDSGLTNPNQFATVVNVGIYTAGAGFSGAGIPGIALEQAVTVKEGYNLIVYAWGVPQAAGGAGVKVAAQYVKTVK